MLEGSLFLFEGFLKEFLWNWRERGVERGLSSQELGNPFRVSLIEALYRGLEPSPLLRRFKNISSVPTADQALSVELLVREPRLRTAKRSGSSVPRELESYH